MELEWIRAEIDHIDEELVALLERRMDLVSQVAAYKKESGKAILDRQRETLILEKVANQVQDADYQIAIQATFADILAHSRHYQEQKLKIHEEN